MGCGWLRDIFHIREYVADANRDQEYMKKLSQTLRQNPKPPFSSVRFLGMIVVGYIWGSIVHLAVPEEEVGGYSFLWLRHLVPLACALGVWSVGNIGHETGGLKLPLITAYVTYPLTFYNYFDESTSFTIMVIAAAYMFDTKAKKWKRRFRPQTSCLKRCLILGSCALLYASLLGSYLYFNASITDEEGEQLPMREAIYHFFKSPWWTDIKQSFIDTYNYAQVHGWMEVWKQIIDLSDPYGEQNAFKVLDLSMGARQSDINSRCKKLAVKYHPDRVQDPEEKKVAQEKFYEIQQACEILSSNRAKKRRKNKQFNE